MERRKLLQSNLWVLAVNTILGWVLRNAWSAGHGIVAKSPQAWPLDGLLDRGQESPLDFPFQAILWQILEHKHPSGWDIVPDTKHKEYGLNQSRHDSRYKLNPQDINLAPALNRYGHTHLTSLVLSLWPFGWPEVSLTRELTLMGEK